MEEKEIIDVIMPIVNARRTHKDNNLYNLQLNAYQLDRIQDLLVLYKQKKDENKELSNSYDELAKENNEENRRCMLLAVENQDLKEKNKELEEGFKIQEHNYQVAMKEIDQRWEDKIEAKIEELGISDEDIYCRYTLQELLEDKE